MDFSILPSRASFRRLLVDFLSVIMQPHTLANKLAKIIARNLELYLEKKSRSPP